MRPYSLLRRIAFGLTFTIVISGLCAFGWLYLKTKWTDAGLRQQALLDQARVIARYLTVDENGSVRLNLPPRLAEAYGGPNAPFHYAVRDANGQFLFDAAPTVGSLPVLSGGRRLYDYDPDGVGPLHVFGAALQTVVGRRTLFIQVEQQTQESGSVGGAAFDEFVTDGGWLGILFLLVLLGLCLWIVRHAIAPLTRISKLAETIGPSHPSVRLPADKVPSEILPLVRSINAALDRLEQGLQRQREFNANAAHQLRTPLAVLMANLDSLNEPEIANLLRADVEHMSRIVSQLLLVARLESPAFNIDEVIDLNAAVADIAASFAPLALASEKTIELSRCDRAVSVRTSSFALRAALGNLIENAIQHTPEGTSVRIRVTSGPAIEVMDSGPGIPAEQRAVVFERFWRGDRTKSGAGLGLAIVDRIMKALHGSVSVGDAPGHGAMFTLIIPAVAVVRSEPSSELALAEV
ncbi:MAG TPA: ATP-binding protein [Pseudolabrys sp.]|nr:ATP-binding protein [Pseudolabrys sp.]